MIKTYFIQSIRILREKPYLSFISIVGTTLAISIITTLLVANMAKVANIDPENNRNRSLYVKWVGVKDKKTGNTVVNSFMSLKTIKECFQSLKTAEAVTVSSFIHPHLATLPGGANAQRCYVLYTDNVFWNVFDFHFLDGKGYDKADFDAGIKKIVISKRLAMSIFGTHENVIGKQMQISFFNYTVSGVVEDVTPIMVATYAHAWIPLTSIQGEQSSDAEGITGTYKCQIVAHKSGDFDAIRNEVDQKVKQYNTSLANYNVEFYGQPDTRYVEDHRFGAGYPDMKNSYLSNIGLILIILLVPAINLSGIILSSMRKRITELGIRKAYGATKWRLIRQILNEQMIYTIIGGALSLVVSYIVCSHLKDFGFNYNNYVGLDIQNDFNPAVFLNPVTFFIAFFFCFIINILSAAIPAWKVSSVPIVESLKEE